MTNHYKMIDHEKMYNLLLSMSRKDVALFGLSTCLRLVDGYESFIQEAKSTDIGLRKILTNALAIVMSGVEKFDFSREIRLCEETSPDTEEFQTKSTSDALDAAGAACGVLGFIDGGSIRGIVDASIMALDVADRKARSMIDSGNIYDKNCYENMIISNQYVQKELYLQISSLDKFSISLKHQDSNYYSNIFDTN